MSKKENNQEGSAKEQPVVTRYDRRVQRRKEQEARQKREARIMKGVGVVILVGLMCYILSFPIRTVIAVNSTYITIDGEKVTKVEFDYNYNLIYNTFMNTYGSYLSYFDIDLSGDLSETMYSDTYSWDDYFAQGAVATMEQNLALYRDAQESGFTYDITEDYEEFVAQLKEYAEESGVSLSSYIRSAYGTYATLSRIEEYVKEALYISAYYEQLTESLLPSAEEVEAYYEADVDSYDVVDYRVIQIDAELPTEPTELADVDEDEDTEEDTDAEDSDEEEEEYEPSEAEIEAAMAEAYALAEAAAETITEEADLVERASLASLNYHYDDWLFDTERESGDVTIVEVEDYYRYFVVQFVQRYRDDTATGNMRAITVSDADTAQSIYEEWLAGEATEESFIALFNTYSEDTSAEGGLYEDITIDDSYYYAQEILDWLFDESRVEGDVTVITPEDTDYSFVLYFVGLGDPEWYISIESDLQSEALTAYLEEITDGIEVSDPKGNLHYLTVATDDSDDTEEESEDTETEESGDTEESDDSTDGTDTETE